MPRAARLASPVVDTVTHYSERWWWVRPPISVCDNTHDDDDGPRLSRHRCPALAALLVDSNELATLPPRLGALAALSSLHVDANPLARLPDDFGAGSE